MIALGANDAGWVGAAAADAERQQRLDLVLAGIDAFLDEVVGWGQCTVLVTPPDNLANYAWVNPWYYAWAAQHINALLRSRAGASTTDNLQLRDFAALSWSHHTWDAANWFAGDNLHLNIAGRLVYTSEIVQGALGCP